MRPHPSHALEIVLLVAAALAAGSPAQAQSRTSDLIPEAPERRATTGNVGLTASLGGAYIEGNVEGRVIAGQAAFVARAGRHQFFSDARGEYRRFGELFLGDRQEGSLLYAYAVRPWLNVYAYSTHARNRFLELDYRTSNSLGVCFHSFLAPTVDAILVSLGATPEYERWSDGARERTWRSTARLQIEEAMTKTSRVGLDVTYTPSLGDVGDYRLFGGSFLEVNITPALLRFRLTIEYEYDARPRPGVLRQDLRVLPSLALVLGDPPAGT